MGPRDLFSLIYGNYKGSGRLFGLSYHQKYQYDGLHNNKARPEKSETMEGERIGGAVR